MVPIRRAESSLASFSICQCSVSPRPHGSIPFTDEIRCAVDRRRELQSRISIFFASASISGAFSGLLAAAIVNLDGKGGQEGWR